MCGCRLNHNLRNEGVAQTMPYARLQQIWKCFKIQNPEHPSARLSRGQDGYDPKFWFLPFYAALQEALLNLFVPGGYVTMDEYMQGSAHRVAYRRVIKGKPNSWRRFSTTNRRRSPSSLSTRGSRRSVRGAGQPCHPH